MLSNVLIFAGIALVVFLLVVLVIQASMARLIFQELNKNNVLHQSSFKDTESDIKKTTPVVRTYGLIIDASTSHTLFNTYGLPPVQTGHAVCEIDGEVSMQPVTYPDRMWMPLKMTSNSSRFQKDVASGVVNTVMIANTTVKVWLSSWPSSSSSLNPLFIIAPLSSAAAVDQTYSVTNVVNPINPHDQSWGTISGNLKGGDPENIPVHIWGF